MTTEELRFDAERYRSGLLEDVIPWWIRHAVDHECGGYLTMLTREGNPYTTDKPVWITGRFVWMLSTLYSEIQPRAQWLDVARHGVDFLLKHGFDTDGRMFFLVDRDGRPLRKRRYMFSEVFTVMALAAYGRAANDAAASARALEIFRRMVRYRTTPGILPPKWDARTRPVKSLVVPMVMLCTAQTLQQCVDDPICDEWIMRSIDEIEKDFLKPEFAAVPETVNEDGSFLDTPEGRLLNPGHAIECAWFVLHESKRRQNDRMKRIGLRMLDWMWEWGWDKEYGGISYFRDCRNLPCPEYWHDMKFWWPQAETIIATLLAYQMTGDAKYARWYMSLRDWTFERFPDPEHGEWFGYLHRDGRISSTVKGTPFKGPFHVPRMQLYCWQLIQEMLSESGAT